MKVVLCDDHLMFVEAMSAVLRARGATVAAVTVDPDAAVVAVAEHAPDVCLLDLGFPAKTAVGALRTLTAEYPRTRVLVLTGSADPVLLGEVVTTGAAGLVRKTRDIGEILAAVDLVHSGARVIDDGRIPAPRSAEPAWSRLADLTRREREVLRLLAGGANTGEIASSLGVSVNTARTHIQNVLMKLGAHSRLEAVALSRRRSADAAGTGAA